MIEYCLNLKGGPVLDVIHVEYQIVQEITEHKDEIFHRFGKAKVEREDKIF